MCVSRCRALTLCRWSHSFFMLPLSLSLSRSLSQRLNRAAYSSICTLNTYFSSFSFKLRAYIIHMKRFFSFSRFACFVPTETKMENSVIEEPLWVFDVRAWYSVRSYSWRGAFLVNLFFLFFLCVSLLLCCFWLLTHTKEGIIEATEKRLCFVVMQLFHWCE